MMEHRDFEKKHARLCGELINASPEPPGRAFSARVMRRVHDDAKARAWLEPAKPPLPSPKLSDAVMRRVHGHAAPMANHRRKGARILAITASIAAMVIAALVLSGVGTPDVGAPSLPPSDDASTRASSSETLGADRTTTVPVEPALVHAAPVAVPETMNATLVFSREFEGRRCWVLDAGLMRGVRQHDLFEWRGGDDGQEGASLRVVGVSASEAICRVEDATVGADLRAGGKVALLRAQGTASIRSSSQQETVFSRLGATVSAADGGVTVQEVFSDIWEPARPRPSASQAYRLGLRRGDRIVSVQGHQVRQPSDLARVLVEAPQHALGMVVCVDRGGATHTLYER